jgi:predicted nucleic-acid-binding protein
VLAADTNVWVRAYLNDDKAQAEAARSALAQARSKGGVFVPLLVLAELSWVLRSRWDRDIVLNVIEGMLQTRGVTVESQTLAMRALASARKGSVGFADHLIAEIAFESGADEIITFDKALARKPRVRRLQ